jgi:hypothetical protein
MAKRHVILLVLFAFSYDETSNEYIREDEGGQIHVQFFDKTCSHAWVDENDVQPASEESLKKAVKGSNGRWAPELRKGASEALKALNMSAAQRDALIIVAQKTNEGVDDDSEDDDEASAEEEAVISSSPDDDNDDDDSSYGVTRKRRKRQTRKAKSPPTTRKRKRSSAPEAERDVDEHEDKENSMSEYERIRLRNIEQRRQMINDLNIDKSVLTPKASVAKRSVSQRGLAAAKKSSSTTPTEPTRKSLRLMKVVADTSLELPAVEPSMYQTFTEERQRPSLEPLKLDEVVSTDDIVSEQEDWLLSVATAAQDDRRGNDHSKISFGNNMQASLAKLSISVRRILSLKCHGITI